jgi:hypothetical protein
MLEKVSHPPVDHRHPTWFQRPDQIRDPLYVVTPIYNSPRYRTRWKLYGDFEKMVAEAGAKLYTIEVAFGERDHAVTTPDHPQHIQLRTSHELWFKENAINVAVSRLPADWKYVAWVDADTRFVRDDWANETIHRLQHFAAVQMWSQYQNLTSDQELHGTAPSFMANYLAGKLEDRYCGKRGGYYGAKQGYPGAPGLAWACRRDAWDCMGGLLDVCICGACDWYMAWSLIGRLEEVLHWRKYHPAFSRRMWEWEERAKALHKNVGVVPGLALHYWHGPKAHRKYGSREQILIDTQFNPDTDLRRDWQGLHQLHVHDARTIQLRDRLRMYMHGRHEDAPTPID